jgi:hypothetical protein
MDQGFYQAFPHFAPKQNAPVQKPKKSFWVDQISTAGGILGGIGGSFVAPIAGTAGGAAIGSGLGEALENLLTGESIGKNVAKEAALGGVFGAGPIKLLKGAGAGAKALATGGDVVESASKAAMTPLRQKAGLALSGTADDLAIKQFRLTPSQLNNFNKKFGEDAGTTIRKYGFHSVDDISHKGIDPLQDEFDAAITSIPGVTKQSLEENLGKRIDKLINAGPSDTKAVGAQLKREAATLFKDKGDVLDPNEVNALRRQFDDLVNYSDKVANPTRYGVNKHMADSLRETLQKADPTGNLKNVGKELQKLRQLAENAGRQEQVGRGSLPLNLPTLLGGAMGGAAGGPVGAAGMAIGTGLVNSPAGRRTAMGAFDKIGSAVANTGKNAGQQTIKGIAGREVAGNLLSHPQTKQPKSLEEALMGQSLATNATTPMNTPSSMNPANASMMDGSYQNGGQESSPYSRENLMADLQRDPKNAEKYLAYYSSLQEVFGTPEEKPLNSTAAGTVTDLENGITNIQQLSDQFAKSGANKPLVGNLLAANPFNTDAQSLRANIARVKQVIGKALEGGVLRKEDEVKYQKILPTLNDTDAVAQAKINAISSDLQRKLGLYKQYIGSGGGGNSLEDALMQYQQSSQPQY